MWGAGGCCVPRALGQDGARNSNNETLCARNEQLKFIASEVDAGEVDAAEEDAGGLGTGGLGTDDMIAPTEPSSEGSTGVPAPGRMWAYMLLCSPT